MKTKNKASILSLIPTCARALSLAALAATLAWTTGCGTIKRGEAKNSEFMHMNVTIFPATTIDAVLIGYGAVYMILDLPFSLVTDTVLLPYDLATKE